MKRTIVYKGTAKQKQRIELNQQEWNDIQQEIQALIIISEKANAEELFQTKYPTLTNLLYEPAQNWR